MAGNMTSHGGQAPINGVMPTTFCEVTYDSDWFEPDDRHLTPYRYSLMRNDTDTNSDTVSLTLPSFTYYEYLRSVYDCRTTPNANRPPPGFHGPPGSHLSEQGRATTWHAYNKDTGSELSRQGVRSEPTRIRPTYPFPSLHLIQKTKQSLQGADSEDEMDEEYAYTDRSRQKLVWVDALNKWLPQKQLQTRPYMTFVGNVPVTDRYLSPHRERQGEGDLGRPSSRPCSRVHSSLESTYRLSNKMTCINLMNNQKREIIRKRAQEIAEQKKALRKTHSTPSYDAKKKLAPDFSEAEMLQRSLSMPGSPTSLVIFPKQVWQDTGSDSTTSGKKEISITLVGAAETDQDLKEKDGMKKVTFDDKELGIVKKPKPEKKKKERKLVTPVGYKAEPQVDKPSPPSSPKKTQRVRSIIRKESYEQDRPSTQDSIPPSLPDLGNLTPEFIEKPKVKSASPVKKKVTAGAVLGNQETTKQLRRPGERDSSYADQLRREELAEERRMKQLEMFDKLKKRKTSMATELEESESHNFDDNSFLAKYCIFNPGSMEMQRLAFNSVDSDNLGWLDGPDVMIALRGINHNLTESEEMYLYRVLEITGYKITHGADFKMFSVLAALSQKIASLDKWMKILIGAMDYKALEMKMFKCKTLWECNVDKDTNHISLEQLCLDLRAGGVSREHEREVRQKLQHLNALDLLDFLTYVPLFIMIHESVLENPLDNTQFR